jgi:hypothetical protein
MNINSIVRKRCVALGAGAQSAELAPHIEKSISSKAAELIREHDEKVKKLHDKLEADMGNLVTERVLDKAFKAHRQQQKEKLKPQPQQKELNYENTPQ